jgi:hypothetical protein
MAQTERRGPPGNENRRDHGTYSVAKHGPEALPDTLRARELEFVSNLATHEGVLRELESSAHRQWAVCETAYAYLVHLMEQGENIWAQGESKEPVALLRRLGSYENGLVRTLKALAELRQDREALDLDALLGKERGDADTRE